MSEEMIAEDSQELDNPILESEAEEIEQPEEFEEESLYDEDTEEVEEAEEDDAEEINFNDKAYKLPKDIAEGVKSMQKDYTQKTMHLAEQRRAFEAHVQMQQAVEVESKQLASIDATLEQFNQLDWNMLAQDNPGLMHQFIAQRAQYENQRKAIEQQIAQKRGHLALQEQQHTAKALEASEAVLKREIKDWSPQLESNLQQFAMDKFGFDAQDVKQAKLNPNLYKLLHMAYQGHQVISKQATKPKVVQQAKPVTTLKAKSTKVLRDPTKMSDAEFAKWRSQYRNAR